MSLEIKPQDFYQYMPRNASEYYSICHDKAYDAAGAHGTYDALFNTKLLGADAALARGNLKNMVSSGVPMNDRWRSAKTAVAFGAISGMKASLKLARKLGRGYQTGPLTP